MLAYKMFSWL